VNEAAFNLVDAVFVGTAAVTLACAAYAVFSRNIVRAVFALLGTFFGVAVLYGLLQADFVAVVQILVYVGGILVLLVFAVMLTSQIETARTSSRSGGWGWGLLAALALLSLLVPLIFRTPWHEVPTAAVGAAAAPPTTAALGTALLSRSLLPFELTALILLGVVIGAVVVARGRKSDRGPDPKERP
jgi:NAD(P)H-quinone oxidoreductase subunit 6